MYQAPVGATPACFQSASSRRWVPDLSPRETKRDCVSAMRLRALHRLGHALDLRRIVFGPDDDEVVVHDESAILHLAFLDVLPLEGGRVHEGDVGLSARGESEGLPRPHRDRS
jgi:hypothetical protein